MEKFRASTAMALVLALSAAGLSYAAGASAQTANECRDLVGKLDQRIGDADFTTEERMAFDGMRREALELEGQGKFDECQSLAGEMALFVDADRVARGDIIIKRQQAQVTVEQAQPKVSVTQPDPRVTVRQAQPEVTVSQAQPKVTVRQAKPQVSIRIPKPEITVRQGQPEITITQAEPEVIVEQAEPKVTVNQAKPEVTVEMADPEVSVQQAEPTVIFDQPEPRIVVQKQQPAVMVEQQEASVMVEQAEPELSFEQQEPKITVEQQKAAVEIEQAKPEVKVEQEQAEVQVEQAEPKVSVEGQLAAQPSATTGSDTDAGMLAGIDGPEWAESPFFNMRSDDLIGREVYNTRGEDLGDIEQLLVGGDQRVYAVIGVGGFLGLGDKEVAVPLTELDWLDDQVVMRGETEESLERLPDFDEREYQPIAEAEPLSGYGRQD